MLALYRESSHRSCPGGDRAADFVLEWLHGTLVLCTHPRAPGRLCRHRYQQCRFVVASLCRGCSSRHSYLRDALPGKCLHRELFVPLQLSQRGRIGLDCRGCKHHGFGHLLRLPSVLDELLVEEVSCRRCSCGCGFWNALVCRHRNPVLAAEAQQRRQPAVSKYHCDCRYLFGELSRPWTFHGPSS